MNPEYQYPFNDEWGPEYVVRIHDPKLKLEGILVIDNTAFGPGKGGIRMTANVSEEEVFRLARTMTWKNALAEIPFGGAKGGLRYDPKIHSDKKSLVQSFARALKPLTPKKYIAGPDVNSGEQEMQWFAEATGHWRSATGKPANLCMKVFGKQGEKCGLPHEFGSTGFGVAHSAKVAAELFGLEIKNATVAIHGFGNVGTFAYQILTEMGAKIISLADASGAVYAPDGFEPNAIKQLIKEKKLLKDLLNVQKISADKFWQLPVDILIPASVTDVINDSNKNLIKAKIIVEGGNIPMRENIEQELHQRKILIVPDFVANAGGVISSYAEYRGYNPKRMFEVVEKKIVKITKQVIDQALKQNRFPREVAMEIAQTKVKKKMASKKSTF